MVEAFLNECGSTPEDNGRNGNEHLNGREKSCMLTVAAMWLVAHYFEHLEMKDACLATRNVSGFCVEL